SELIEREDGSIVVLAPCEAWEAPRCRGFLERISSEPNGVRAIESIDVNASMHNGGGPACLRLRVRLTQTEVGALAGRVLYTRSLDATLRAWVERHYRDRLSLEDLADPE